jgi:hypothetical protein
MIQLETSNGEIIYVETRDLLESPVTAQSSQVIRKVADVGQSIADVCADIFSKVSLDELAPDELTLEFSVTLGADLSVPFIAKSSGEGTFTVKALWKKSEKKREGRR